MTVGCGNFRKGENVEIGVVELYLNDITLGVSPALHKVDCLGKE